MNIRFVSLASLLILAGVLGLLHQFGLSERLYWFAWWYDIPMHFIGGMVVGIAYAWGAAFVLPALIPGNHLRFVPLLLFALMVGVVWEAFEYLIGFYDLSLPVLQALDTFQDIVLDVAGASAAFALFSRSLFRYEHS